MPKALGLLSGGLDSCLAALTLKRQGIDVTGIAFTTPFFGSRNAERMAGQMEIPLIVKDISEVHLAMLKAPRYGYGKNMNPCIDCHAMMFRLAAEVMADEGFDFLFSGEVLGQRPMSQNANALRSVANFSGHPERILRPLSAKVLPITAMEEQGLVDREQLLDIQGRSRKRQDALAKAWGLVDYPSSGGGCLLTEKHFSDRLRDLFEHEPSCSVNDVEILKVGRQFRLSAHAKLALGRHQQDNEALRSRATERHVILHTPGIPGPVGLISGAPTADDLRIAGAVVASYGKGKDLTEIKVQAETPEGATILLVTPMTRTETEKLII